MAVVPFGGGTSVVGGVEPLRGEHAAVVSVDTAALGELSGVDRTSKLARVQSGMRALRLERLLSQQGLTLGHYPQSFEYVTLGGCVATRSAGQASTGYGTIDAMVKGVSLVTPSGPMRTSPLPTAPPDPLCAS